VRRPLSTVSSIAKLSRRSLIIVFGFSRSHFLGLMMKFNAWNKCWLTQSNDEMVSVAWFQIESFVPPAFPLRI
jgi:hypothetical protein